MDVYSGESGCGKSTLGSLLMRLYDVDQGSVKIGGADIRDVSQKSLADVMACVSQAMNDFCTSDLFMLTMTKFYTLLVDCFHKCLIV